MKFLGPLHFLLQRCWSQGLPLVLWSILHHHHSPSSLSYTYNVQSPWRTKLACISCNIKKDEQKFSTLPYYQWFWGQLSSSRLLWCCSHSGTAELRQTSYEVHVPVGSLTAATELRGQRFDGVFHQCPPGQQQNHGQPGSDSLSNQQQNCQSVVGAGSVLFSLCFLCMQVTNLTITSTVN